MNKDIKEIGIRLKGLREALDLTEDEFAERCNIPLEEYVQYELGKKDISVSIMKKIAETYNVDLSVLMFDDEPRMSSYSLTRKGTGQTVERVKAYGYQSLAGGFNNAKADIFEVTVEPNNSDEVNLSQHQGQEFNLILEGSMLLKINNKDLILNEGDSIYFDSSFPHGMKALEGKKVKFITVIL